MPNIVYQPARPNPLNNIIGGVAGFMDERERLQDRQRQIQAFELDKQRAEFELATARQEQARKIESENAFRDGAAFALANSQGFDSQLQQQARKIGAVQRDPYTPGYEGKVALQIQTRAQEEYAAHEKQMAEQSAAIAQRMTDPDLAKAHLELERTRALVSRVDFERKQTIADLSQWFKNDPIAQADEGMVAGFEQVIQNLQQADARDESLPKAIDEARAIMVKGIQARATSEAVGREKVRTFTNATKMRSELHALGSLDDTGMAALEYMQAGLEGLPVHTMEDWEKYRAKFDEALVRQMDATLRRKAKGNAAKDPVSEGVLWDKALGEAREQLIKEKAAGLVDFANSGEFEQAVFHRGSGLFTDRGGSAGFVEGKARSLYSMGQWPPGRRQGAAPAKNGKAAPTAQRPAASPAEQRKQVLKAMNKRFGWSEDLGPGGSPRGTKMLALKSGDQPAAYALLAELVNNSVPEDEAILYMWSKGYDANDFDEALLDAARESGLQNETQREQIRTGHKSLAPAKTSPRKQPTERR